MFIEQPSLWLRWIYPDALWRMSKHERAVYLTFDDGPIPEVTPRVLDILDTYHIKATFFMVGDNVRKHPAEFQMVKDRGHRIGNHTFNHIGGLRHGIRGYLNNIDKADTYLHTDLVRPPYGWLKWEQYFFLRRHYQLVMWDLVTRDYSKRLNAKQVLWNVRHYTRPGSIITFHDSLKSQDKLWFALPSSIEWLQSQGYEFKIFPKMK
ncbi:MAG: polysaccharide deacetylase family protein [Bacteroidaceae bacterium]|jgi:peptidoglycan/xylan/chitin deacetylase (PgdA/CDA1 family)|nr:polysaccharide deacetylase family protein [Bacteroidaceae bacterium]